ncbi:MAG: oligosaccharide flippase family protein [Polaribacter sp.]|nr:oligosaccharide flippase family protein [Polaribacter sp.]
MSLFENKDFRIIAKNFSYLGLMRFTNIGFKLFLVGYLVRILGEKNYGIVTWLDSVIQYFLMLINFGFNIYAAKYIVDNKGNNDKINEIVSSIYIIKIILFLFSLIAIFCISFSNDFNPYRELLILFALCGVGEVLFPIWFFQGKENLKSATVIVFLSRLFLILGVLFFVKIEENINEYIFLTVLSTSIMGILGTVFIFKYYDLNFSLISYSTLKKYLSDAFPFFLGRFLSLIFNFGTIFLIGKYCEYEQVTGFDICLKIIMVSVIPFEMLQQAVFPSLARTKDKSILKKIVISSFFLGLFASLIIFLISDRLLLLFGGEAMLNYVSVLNALTILAPFVALTFILGTCSLVAFGFNKEYNISLIGTSICYMLILIVLYCFNLINFWNLIYLRIFGDILMCLVRLYYSIKRKTLV